MILEYARRFAQSGYFVFPMYSFHGAEDKGAYKPYGWARNLVDRDEVSVEKIIPATDDPNVVDKWDELVKSGYGDNAFVSCYGVLGLNCVIFDLDCKDGKDGLAEFKALQAKFKIPQAEFVVRSKSGGYHLYYTKPDKLKNLAIKSVANISIAGQRYPGVDIRGNGGMVIGPTCEGDSSEWQRGVYQIIKGSPDVDLSVLPTDVVMSMSKASVEQEYGSDLVAEKPAMDELDKLKRGEIPEVLSKGNRNVGFFHYLTALRNKGFSASTAKTYALQLVEVTEDKATLSESVNIDDMISRIWKIDLNNPYDVCRDLLENGLYRLTSYKSKLTYVILNQNPYIDSRAAHDLPSIKQLLARFARKMTDSAGKAKVVNPADAIDAMITPDREVATLGFRPGASEVFTLTDAEGGKKYLNTWRDPRINATIANVPIAQKYLGELDQVIQRIFGPKDSDEYKLAYDFPSWALQRPGVKPSIAPFIMSRTRGAGKSLYLSLLSQIFGYTLTGELQVRRIKVGEISTRFFNPSGSSMLLFDEVQFPVHRDMRREATEFWRHMKDLVTSDTIPVEFKGGDVGVQMPNPAMIVLAGNSGSNFPIEEFDRRIWLIDNEPPELEEGVADGLFEIVKNLMPREDRQAVSSGILHFLANRKIRLPLDRMRAPMTEIKQEMYLNTLNDLEYFWVTHYDGFDNLMTKTPIMSKSSIMYLISCSERLAHSRWREDPEGTFRELKRRGMVQPVKTINNSSAARVIRGVWQVKPDGALSQDQSGRDTLFTCRDHGQYNTKTNDELLQLYLQNLNSIATWRRGLTASRNSSVAQSIGAQL
mgnify:CR=1 FL=1